MSFLTDVFGGGAANDAARVLEQGSVDAQQTLQGASDQFNPYYNTGVAALGRANDVLAGDVSQFRTDPGYQFALTEGQKAVENSGAARGTVLSGKQLKALTQYGQGVADQQYNNFIDRNLGVATLGFNAANSQLGAASGIANAQQGAADGRASGLLAEANIINGLANAGLETGITGATTGFNV